MGHSKILVALVIGAVCSRFWTPRLVASDAVKPSNRVVTSPNGEISFQLLDRNAAFLQYKIVVGRETVIEPSRIGIVLDGVNLAEDAVIEKIEPYEINEQFACLGVHSTALNHCCGAEFRALANKS